MVKKKRGRPKIREGVDVNAPRPTRLPPTVDEIDESLVGKRVWFLHPTDGVTSIVVTAIYNVQGKNGKPKWGLWYDYKDEHDKIHSKTIWVRDQTLFKTRTSCHKWIRAMLEKSMAEMKVNKSLGLE